MNPKFTCSNFSPTSNKPSLATTYLVNFSPQTQPGVVLFFVVGLFSKMLARFWTHDDVKPSTIPERIIQHMNLPFRIMKILLVFLALGIGVSVLGMYMIRYTSSFESPRPGLMMRPCVSEEKNDDLDLGHWIRAPSSLMHGMSDEELFWRASFVAEVKAYPYKRVPKVAFMFLTRGPLPLSPLWDKFFKGNEDRFSIYVHSLPSYKAEFDPSSVFYRRQIPSQVAEWGRMSMCDAEKRLLANALLDLANERFVLLSESCIPLYNFSTIYQYLMKSQQSFMGSFDDPSPHGRGRYNPKMAPLISIAQWRKGSQWFEVNRKIATTLVSDTKYYPSFKEYCKPACYVDEHYFPTMLSIEAPNLIANRSVTWVDWSRGGAHPGTFGKGDINDAFVKRIFEGHNCLYNGKPSSVCVLFARKFAPSALEPLLNLSNRLLSFG